MANSFTGSLTLFSFWRRFNLHFPKALVGWKNIVDEFEPRKDKGDREGIPHTHPIPQVIRLEFFLESG